MKERGLVLSVTAIAMAMGLMAGCTNKQAAAMAQTEAAADASNPDKEAGVSTEELREKPGDAPKQDGEVKLGVVAESFDNEYWRTLRGGYGEYRTKTAAAGCNVIIDVASTRGENDEQGQLSIVKDMINKKYIGFLLSPISDGNLTPGVGGAKKAGISVINVNDSLIINADPFVGPKADQNGELAAEWTADKLGGKGKAAIVIGMPKAFAARQRTESFENRMAVNAKDIEIVAEQNADWDCQKSKDLANTWIKQYPNLNTIFCNNDTMTLGVVETAKPPGKDILVVDVDGIGGAYDSIRRGELGATTDSFPFYKAQITGEVMLRRLGGQEIPRVLWTPQALIDSENVDKPAEETIGWTDPVYVKQIEDSKETIISQRVRPLADILERGQNMAIMIHLFDITKQFLGNKALGSVDFTVDKGEIHALLRENGAGESTLLNILHGIYPDYDGNVETDGRKVGFKNANDAIEFGITKVHQEVNLMTELMVGQNIVLGHEVTRGFFVDYDAMYKKTDVILERLGCKFRNRDRATPLSTGEMQMILVAKALFHNAKIISFDEPTSTLIDHEVDRLLKMIMEFKDQGVTILYITHRLDEVFTIADKANILCDGTYIIILNMKEISEEELIRHMVGWDVFVYVVRNNPLCTAGEVMLEARDLCKNGAFEHISFELHRGEILSFVGLVGSKRTDMMWAISEADPYTSGEVYIKGKRTEIKSPRDALQYSLGPILENRRTQGFAKNSTNAGNMALASMNRFCSRGSVNARKIYDNCAYYTGEMNLHPVDSDYLAESLSGGNAQKVIIAKWMTTDADTIIFDEPTKGIDVGAKVEIYRLMEGLVAGGKSTIMVFSELPEVMGISDKVVAMRGGKIMSALNHDELNEEVIMSFAMGG